MDKDACQFRVIPPFAVIFPLWWNGQLYSNVKYIYKYLKRSEICNVPLVDGNVPSRLLNKILERVQETHCGFSMGLQYLMTKGVGSSVCAVDAHAVYQTSHVYGCAHQLWSLGKNEHCKMEVHKHVFSWVVGTCSPLPLQWKQFFKWLCQVTLR